MTWRTALFACVLAGRAAAAVPEPDGYRQDRYRDPVPDSLRGARVIHTAALARLVASAHPLLVDVLPAPDPPADARPGLPRLQLPHADIPGSVWLADTGRGALPPRLKTWFRATLQKLSGGDPGRPIVFYCLSQCWMSWNAAKRAVSYGYTQVIWYPDGADQWQKSGLPTVIATPSRPADPS